jgi:chaperone required for assembly of F1-ATPase
MIITEGFKSGFKKTTIETDRNEVLKEYVRSLKKRFNTSASFREMEDGKVTIELNGHFSAVKQD